MKWAQNGNERRDTGTTYKATELRLYESTDAGTHRRRSDPDLSNDGREQFCRVHIDDAEHGGDEELAAHTEDNQSRVET